MPASQPRVPDAADDLRPRRTKPQPASVESLLTIADILQMLQVSRRWLERQRAAGEFPRPTMSVGKNPRWTQVVINRWIEQQQRSHR